MRYKLAITHEILIRTRGQRYAQATIATKTDKEKWFVSLLWCYYKHIMILQYVKIYSVIIQVLAQSNQNGTNLMLPVSNINKAHQMTLM